MLHGAPVKCGSCTRLAPALYNMLGVEACIPLHPDSSCIAYDDLPCMCCNLISAPPKEVGIRTSSAPMKLLHVAGGCWGPCRAKFFVSLLPTRSEQPSPLLFRNRCHRAYANGTGSTQCTKYPTYKCVVIFHSSLNHKTAHPSAQAPAMSTMSNLTSAHAKVPNQKVPTRSFYIARAKTMK